MPPFPIAFREFPHQLARRQNGGSSDSVTLSITRATTTYTTVIGLSPSTVPSNDASPTTSSSPSIQTIVTPALVNADPPGPGVIAGAVLGSVLGVLVVLAIIYKCCYSNESALYMPRGSRSYDDSDSDDSSSSSSQRVRHRGGGGDGFGHSNRRGEKVRRPARATTTRSRRRRSRSDYSSGTRSEVSWSHRDRRRRSSSMTNKNGMWGWTWGGTTRPVYYTSRSEWPGTRTNGFKTDD